MADAPIEAESSPIVRFNSFSNSARIMTLDRRWKKEVPDRRREELEQIDALNLAAARIRNHGTEVGCGVVSEAGVDEVAGLAPQHLGRTLGDQAEQTPCTARVTITT